ncbi:glycosyltransferase family 2 protein [Paenibacillus sp. CF384]|uniref:glycosyltransferase family 2 protein n=1 Tax=Paenibacillus sp. CF384 TaxID=1884382 RepID=UPI00089A9E11|nr:glycosyltransferase family 2 protein [Paenibacillus sp. CF384]SDX95597.1 Glycosyl transferase family 2 [Paenibacillus sp. CF384]
MLLGIHVLACNEEDVLGRCLQSVQGLADEIIVTDTGSVDRTAAIAEAYGARVIHQTWEDDFAAARNAGLDAARTIWVLVLDADEYLSASIQRTDLRELLRSAQADAYRVTMENRYGGEMGETVGHEAVRLFRADRGIRYQGAIHEQLVRPGSGPIAVDGPLCKLTMEHDGYMPDVIARKGKAARNLRLVEKALLLQPDDPFHLYNKGVTLCQLNKPKDACTAFSLAYLFVRAEAPYRPVLIRDWAKALLALDDAGGAAALLHREVDRYADYPDVQLLYGDSLMRQGRVMEARSAYEAALEAGAAGSAAARYVAEAGAGTYRARCGLAAAEAALGRGDSAQRLYAAAVAEAPRFGPALAGWAEQQQAAGERDEAIRAALASSVGLAAPGDLALQARVLGGIGAYAAALPLWRAAQPLAPADAREYAACLVGAGHAGEARAVLLAALGVRAAEDAEEEGEKQPAAKVETVPHWPELCVDAALCSWSEGGALDEGLRGLLHGSADAEVQQLEAVLLAMDGFLAGTVSGLAIRADFASLLLDRALRLGMLTLAGKLQETGAELREGYAERLYLNGYTHAAAGLLLSAMESRQLRATELFGLGEILYGKQLYGEALSLFEQALQQGAAPERARFGAAACSLSLAREALLPWAAAASSQSQQFGGGWPHTDLEQIGTALIRVQAAGWRTKFSAAQRRRAHVQAG